MNILFITYFYYDLYKPLLEEMERQGHSVTLIEDKSIRFDYCPSRFGHIHKFIRFFLRTLFREEKRYWDNTIKQHPELEDSYDVLICMPGLSYCSYIHNKLLKRNPNIKSCLLINDSLSYYNHVKNKSLFNKVYTFDYKDAKNNEGVQVLDAYWKEVIRGDNKYQLALIGSDHDDRLDIVKKIYPQLVNNNISFYIKVVSKRPVTSESFIRRNIVRLKRILYHLPDPQKVWEEKMKLPFVTDQAVPIETVRDVINSSACILETDREGQSGLTLRDMWALASGKKIITTNSFIRETPYYNEEQISFIDRNDPIINIDFLNKSKDFPMNELLLNQRLDYWMRKVLTFDA